MVEHGLRRKLLLARNVFAARFRPNRLRMPVRRLSSAYEFRTARPNQTDFRYPICLPAYRVRRLRREIQSVFGPWRRALARRIGNCGTAMIAILEAKRAGLLRVQHLPANIVSGVIVGVVALPLALAFAIASGAKPEQGLYSAIVAGLVVSIFGGTGCRSPAHRRVRRHSRRHHRKARHRRAANRHADGRSDADPARRCPHGRIIKFIPDPVIVGFTAGIGVIIWVGEWRDFFGLPASRRHSTSMRSSGNSRWRCRELPSRQRRRCRCSRC